MPYKMVGSVVAIPRDCNSFDALIVYKHAAELAKAGGVKVQDGEIRWYWGTPRHPLGYIAKNKNDRINKRTDLIGRLLDFFSYAEQFRYEWGVYIEV